MNNSTASSTKIKLLAVFLIVSLIPLILLGVASSIILKRFEKNTALSNSSDVAAITSEHLTEYFSELQNAVETATVNEDVRTGITSYNANAQMFLEGIIGAMPSVEAAVIMDMSGTISQSSVNHSGFDDLSLLSLGAVTEDIRNSFGLSDLLKYSDAAAYDGVFVYSGYITDENNENAGILSLIINMSYLNECIEAVGTDGMNQLMICDWNGNIFTSNKSAVRNYADISEFSGMSKFFENISVGNVYAVQKYKYEKHDKALQYAVISNHKNSSGRHWNVIAVTNLDAIDSKYQNISSSIQSTIFAIGFIDIILIIVFVTLFLRPVENAMRTLCGADVNVSSQRILINGNSDLDKLNRQINAILDMISESEQRYRNIVDMTDNIIFEYSVKKDAFTFSDNYNKKFSYRAKSEKYEDSFFVNATVFSEDEDAYKTFVTSATEGKSVQGEFRFKTIYNDYAWYLVRSASIRDSYNSIIKIVGVMIDIDRTKSREQTLMNKASLDPLTQAYNRESFELSLLNEFELSEMRKGKDAVLFIDLDDFKHFNDEYNHTLGDEVLMFTVNTAKRLVGKNGFVGRYGGDEFVVCYRETEDMDSSALAQSIISALGSGFDSESSGDHIVMCCSVGIAYITPKDSDPAAVIDRADQAMYRVKKSGKSNYAIYN